MKTPPPRMVLVLYVMGFLSREIQGCGPSSSTMDMAKTCFDDQYDGCVFAMEDRVGALQLAEFKNSIYDNTWKEAAIKWNQMKARVSTPKGLKAEYAIAILAYTKNDSKLYSQFNSAVREAGKSEGHYFSSFQFKSFHYLLTRALQVLQLDSNGRCYTTYRGVGGIQFITERSKKVRFGSFTSSSHLRTEAMKFGNTTLFNIKTCYGAYIKEFSFHPTQEEVLIPPYEVFLVEDFSKTQEGIRIRLTSTGRFSNYNCVHLKGGGLSHLQADARMLFLFWGILLMAGALGVPGCL